MSFKLLPMLLVAMLAGGCSVYTNIPPENGDWASNNPNTGAVIDVSVASIQKTLENEPFNSPFYVALPPRTTPETYAIVVNALGDDALIPANVPVVELDEKGRPIKSKEDLGVIDDPAVIGEFPSVEVRAIYIRGADAKVDVVRPSNSGRRLSTVDLVWEAGFGWSAVNIRAWRVDPDKLPQPATPPSQQPLKSEAAAE